MKKEKLHIVTIALGIILSAAIVCSNVFLLDRSFQGKENIKSEKAKEEKKATAFTAAPTITPPSSVHVHFSVASYCLFEINTETDEECEVVSDFSFHPRRYLLTLFRVIISPNAP
jgi:hypothetical protein